MGARPRTKIEVIFRGLLKIPCETAHNKARIPRHEMDILDPARGLIGQTGCEGKDSLLEPSVNGYQQRPTQSLVLRLRDLWPLSPDESTAGDSPQQEAVALL